MISAQRAPANRCAPADDTPRSRDLFGPDLDLLPPLRQQQDWLDVLGADPAAYAKVWLSIANAIGANPRLLWHPESTDADEPGIWLYSAMDDQRSERSARVDMLQNHLNATPAARLFVISTLVSERRYIDNRGTRLADVVLAVRRFLRAGGRLMITPWGDFETGIDIRRVLPAVGDPDASEADCAAVTRMHQIARRWRVQPLLEKITRRLGKQNANGWIVLGARS